MSRAEILDRFQAKAGCMHTQVVAFAAWRRLKKHLTREQRNALLLAWSHHVDIGEGRGALDHECAAVRKSWAQQEARVGGP